MATEKQIAANRRNAQKATGPRTPLGKATSRLNRFRNGLHSTGATLPPESWKRLLQIRERFMLVCRPRTRLQHRLVAQTACAEWKLFQWKQIHTGLLHLAERTATPRRQDRLRSEFSRREARMEQDLRESFQELVSAYRPYTQPMESESPEECAPPA